jgi:hypothetical protein
MRGATRSSPLWLAALGVAACCTLACAGRHELERPSDRVQLRIAAGEYEIVGDGAGQHCVKRYLGMVQLRAPSFAEAERQALARAGGTFLLGKRAYEGLEGNWLVVADHCRYVEGTGVDFPPSGDSRRRP